MAPTTEPPSVLPWDAHTSHGCESHSPLPTQAEGVRKAADAWNRERLTPTIKKLLTGWLAITR